MTHPAGAILVKILGGTLPEVWPRLEPILAHVLSRDAPDAFSLKDVRDDAFHGQIQLWVAFDLTTDAAIAICSTRLSWTRKGKKICTVEFCGGRDLWRWQHFVLDIEAWAQTIRIRGWMRPGWQRALGAGYRHDPPHA